MRVDEYQEYLTSTHGKRMAAAETRTATCSDCHGAHGVFQVKDARSPVAPIKVAQTCAKCHANAALMTAFGRPTTIVDDWSASVHAAALLKRGDTSAPTCSTCHGSHGATPPGLSSVVNVCAQCHVREGELFNASPKKALFEAMGQKDCLVCHSNHRIVHPQDAWVGLKEPAVCATCHDDTTGGAAVITAVRNGLDRLSERSTSATALLDHAEQRGLLVDEGRAALQEGNEHRIHSRVLVHTFAAKPFGDMAAQALASFARAQRVGDDAMAELEYRRRGLAIATVLILGFLATLGWKIRDSVSPIQPRVIRATGTARLEHRGTAACSLYSTTHRPPPNHVRLNLLELQHWVGHVCDCRHVQRHRRATALDDWQVHSCARLAI